MHSFLLLMHLLTLNSYVLIIIIVVIINHILV